MGKQKCCFFCLSDKEPLMTCNSCEEVQFCSEEHGNIHCPPDIKSEKKGICFPFRVAYNEGPGHFLVATRDIQPGEMLLKDRPFAEGPGSKSPPVCLQCSKDAPDYRCSKCGLPVCNEACEKGHLHGNYECAIFAQAFDREGKDQKRKMPTIENMYAPCPLYTCITPLRLLLRQQRAKESNEQALADRVNTLMDHGQERRMDMKTWMLNNVLVVGFIKKVLGQKLDDHMIQRAIGLLKTNSVKLDAKPGYTTGSAIYPTFSYLNHNCVCNSRTKKYIDQNGDNVIELYAVMPIKKGEEITTRYTTPQLGTMRRQQLVQSQWYFTCQCKRCLDPTELGSHTNSAMCPNCQDGIILPQQPTNLTSNWICDKCGEEKLTSATHVMRLLLKVEAEISQAEGLHILENEKELLERIINENSGKTLHPNHFLLTGAREKLIQSIMGLRSQMIKDPKLKLKPKENLKLLEYQVELFRQVADVMTKVDLPRDFWDHTQDKMENELANAQATFINEEEAKDN